MAPKRSSISTFLAQAENIKIELSKLVIDPAELTEYIDKFNNVVVPSSKSIQSFAKLLQLSHRWQTRSQCTACATRSRSCIRSPQR